MKRPIQITIRVIVVLTILYISGCALLYFFQESFLFFPNKLSADYKFQYPETFEEVTIQTKDKTKLNALLFKADSSKGVIFFLHGNGGTLESWGNIAPPYLALHYDVFALDYRSYGKSEGKIFSEEQFFSDAQTAYDTLKKHYSEEKIIVLGYSIGTGTAAMLASINKPKQLILQAPYYSLTDVMQHHLPFLPGLILKYKFETYKYLEQTKVPVAIFHGNKDRTIYYESYVKLKNHLKPGDMVTILDGQAHAGVNDNEVYLKWVKENLEH